MRTEQTRSASVPISRNTSLRFSGSDGCWCASHQLREPGQCRLDLRCVDTARLKLQVPLISLDGSGRNYIHELTLFLFGRDPVTQRIAEQLPRQCIVRVDRRRFLQRSDRIRRLSLVNQYDRDVSVARTLQFGNSRIGALDLFAGCACFSRLPDFCQVCPELHIGRWRSGLVMLAVCSKGMASA